MATAESAGFARGEQRTITMGVIVVAVAMLIMFGIVPMVRGLTTRERQLQLARAKLAELTNLVQGQPQLDAQMRAREQALALQPRRVLRARSRALAASAMQSLVQELAEASNVTVTRLDVVNLETSGDLPITLAANGDIAGLATLLEQLRRAQYVLIVDKLTTQNNSALRGAPDVLQITMSLHAPVIVE